MLASWEGQRAKIPLTVSMSFETGVRSLVTLPEREGLRIVIQERKMSQFEHYKALAEEEWEEGTWVLFTDDDDLWHETRSGMYGKLLRESEAEGLEPSCIVTKTIRMVGWDDPPGVESAEDVTAMMSCGMLLPRFCCTVNWEDLEVGNYVEYSVRMETLRGFVRGVSAELLRSRYCDAAFGRHLVGGGKGVVYAGHSEETEWLYLYRRDPGIGQVCLTAALERGEERLETNVEVYCATHGSFDMGAFEKEMVKNKGAYVPARMRSRVKKRGKSLRKAFAVPAIS
ncbi:g7767 [Coccomyxa viridis]|uniref:G7767 protein n=1 Tax=Coccomyxa viridis TaxID=1274662 RepID=A0ABP1G189_9CHLO